MSRWGDEGLFRSESAKMLAILLFGLEGTPYIYQGQELGMTNIRLSLDEYQDIETRNMFTARRAKGYSDEALLRSARAKSRDNARTPMQWSAAENAGFTTGKPWLKVNENFREINAARQVGSEASVFTCYQTLIRLRKKYAVFTEGVFELLLPDNEDLFAYSRTAPGEKLLVICNFRGRETDDPLADTAGRMTLLIANYADAGAPGRLRPYEARMYYKGGI